MAPADSNGASEAEAPAVKAAVRPRVSDWLWRPWYAKLWWAAIPIYWLGAAASLKLPPLADLYESALVGFLNVLFFPMTALLVLGVGYARAWIDRMEWNGEGGDLLEDDEYIGHDDGRVGGPPPFLDPYDPRSGTIYIGNPLNQQRLGHH